MKKGVITIVLGVFTEHPTKKSTCILFWGFQQND